ncbi:MAG: OmpA family protein [Proteobacteria bacterium]|nr:OmpA family protein [Pseudomonadota bacterium]
MIDNPFAEPEDDDRTIIRPAAGRKAPTAAAAPTIATPSDATVVAAPVLNARPPARPRLAGRRERPPAREDAPTAAAFGAPLLDAAAPLLQLLARLRNTLTPPQAGDLHDRTVREIRAFEQRAEAAGVAPDMLRPAHYALCASLDDVVLNTPWGSAGEWYSRSLVSTFHHEVQSGERFFELLSAMRQNPAKFLAVIELMYLCLSLGFMGRYRLSPRGPAEIDSLREEVYAAIASVRPRAEADLSPHWSGVSAPYRPARPRLPIWVAGASGLAVVAGVFAWMSISLNTASDKVAEQMIALPPQTMPVIARSGPVIAPPPAPAPATPGPLERLRGFLAPEIAAGLVQVLGTEETPIIRLTGDSFASGSAGLLPKGRTTLARIGAALKAEHGQVEVDGYTDNQPIRTVRFPSNYALSTARAQSASAVLAQIIDAGRLTAEGRADADPIAPNTTEQGRAANRRIEIVLHTAA